MGQCHKFPSSQIPLPPRFSRENRHLACSGTGLEAYTPVWRKGLEEIWQK
jgi:hypothetical protein